MHSGVNLGIANDRIGEIQFVGHRLVGLFVAAFGYAGGYTFPPVDIILASVLPIYLFGPLGFFYTYVRPNPIIAVPCMNIVAYSLFIAPIILFGQLMIGLNYPLIDPYLIAFDQTLGFDWMSAINIFTELPGWVSDFSTILYNSTNNATILVAVFLIFSGKHQRLEEFVTYFILTALTVNLISGFLPAETAYDFYKPAGLLYERLSPVVGLGYNADFVPLRDGSLKELKIIGATGMVAFPSFHTILALLLIYVTRGCGVFSIVITIWCLGIVATTPFDGAHYISDLIGGAVLLMATIATMQRLEPHLTKALSPKSIKQQPSPQPVFSA